MLEVSFDKVVKYLGSKKLLSYASFQINEGDRVGIIGQNGSGKSTILKLLGGLMTLRHCAGYPYAPIPPGYDEGWVKVSKGITSTVLHQIHDYPKTYRVVDVLHEGFATLNLLEAQMKQMEEQMVTDCSDALHKIMLTYQKISAQYEALGGYEKEKRFNKIASGLGFSQAFLNQPFESLSGGEQTSVALGKLLISDANCLLLDEPTNHLDLNAILWLQSYLKTFKGIVVLVSHDRSFLDHVTNKIIAIEDKKCVTYHGNYSYYKTQKKAHQLSNKPLTISGNKRSGNDVLLINQVSKSFGSKHLFKELDLIVRYGERLALIGPNGSGKTTLIKLILGQIEPDSGSIKIGHNVKIAYLAQNETLEHQNQKVLEYIRDGMNISEANARAHLARFLFPGGNVFKTLKLLSGGELVRLRLAKLLLDDINLLILDEPTNHLDIESIEGIEQALIAFKGTLLVISHDRYFVHTVAQKALVFKDHACTTYQPTIEAL